MKFFTKGPFHPTSKRVMRYAFVFGAFATIWSSGGFGGSRGFPFYWHWFSDLGPIDRYSWLAFAGDVLFWLIITLMLGQTVEAGIRESASCNSSLDITPAPTEAPTATPAPTDLPRRTPEPVSPTPAGDESPAASESTTP